ncbi:hypothetical protein [Amycolatopsis jiangsuensis]|uniref:N-acetyltransferase domain-containing protein n=1 Tax=Amycolatopsis jiangsuensis TaxID=1181879 RepID=A0A840J5T4_9PSEU|nr:hypothetical protein [Amycolatopsis jiangsuensis]MBB4688777.1 hypothetical protein [Amycolatopsis jiangsuensis]
MSHWEVATDADEVHTLLRASDRHQGDRFGSPVPARNPATTESRVRAGVVQVLRHSDRLAAMFTLTWQPPFEEPAGVFPFARTPAYLSRLAVRPDLVTAGSLAGLQCLRRAVGLALEQGADVLRAEANPDLESTVDTMVLLGFSRCDGEFGGDGTPRRVYLQHRLG